MESIVVDWNSSHPFRPGSTASQSGPPFSPLPPARPHLRLSETALFTKCSKAGACKRTLRIPTMKTFKWQFEQQLLLQFTI